MFKVGGLLIVLMFPAFNAAANEDINVTDGVWFRCEFAHSQTPPDDNCDMFDDDGFQIIEGKVYHVKITNSDETKCRGERVGNCFYRTKSALVGERQEIGPIEISQMTAAVSWFGCAQKYHLADRGSFVEITPDDTQCWWTPDKRYFVSRYTSPIKIIEEE